MIERKLDELATDIDDAATIAEEIEVETNPVARGDKLEELDEALNEASERIDDIEDPTSSR